MAKKKRINPNRIPISQDRINEDELIAEVSTGNLFCAWLLILPALAEMPGMTQARIIEIWDAVNDFVSNPNSLQNDAASETQRAEKLMGIQMPHRHIDLTQIRTKGELAVAKKKLKEDALHSALSMICLGIDTLHEFDASEIRNLFLNADITLAEISNGCRTYDSILEQLQERGIAIRDDRGDMMIMEENSQIAENATNGEEKMGN